MDFLAVKSVLAAALGYGVYKGVSTTLALTSNEHTFNSRCYSNRSQRHSSEDSIVKELPYFLNKDKLYIYYKVWEPKDSVKAVMVISHGLNEHCGRYESFASEMNKLGIKVYALDQQGHGRSEGDRLFVKNFHDFADDILVLSKMAISENPGKKIFLLGHSMGGLVASLVAIKHQDLFTGLLLSGSAVDVDHKVNPDFVIKLLTNVAKVFPKLRLMPLDIRTLSRDKDVTDLYIADPLVSDLPATLGLLSKLVASMTEAQENAEKITIPVFICHGVEDGMIPVHASRILNEKISSKDKTYVEYEDGFHESLNEPNRNNLAIKDISIWLKSRI